MDNAGNISDPFLVEFSQTATGNLTSGLASDENLVLAGEPVPTAYSILSNQLHIMAINPPARKDNFYIKSLLPYHLRGGVQVVDPSEPVPPEKLTEDEGIVCVNVYRGKGSLLTLNPMQSIFRQVVGFSINSPIVKRFDISWDGKTTLGGFVPDGVPEGVYIVWLWLPNERPDATNFSNIRTTFKVSHRAVITLGKWITISVPSIAPARAAHIINNHILQTDPTTPIIEQREPVDLFSNYSEDPDYPLSTDRNIYYCARGSDLDGYNEYNDPKFILTKMLMTNYPENQRIPTTYQDVAKMGAAILKYPSIRALPPSGTSAYTAPIVFPTGRVVWVRNVDTDNESHYNIFPDYDSRSTYEKTIQNK